MPRKVFFSFHHKRDVFRVGQVRNAWRFLGEAPPVLDGAAWEKVKRSGDAAIKSWIDTQLKGTSVTCVLIGAETASRRWVRYEIEKSLADGKGMLGITIHHMNDIHSRTDYAGRNPFESVPTSTGLPLASYVSVYDWVYQDGRKNIGAWVEAAAAQWGR